MGSGVGGKFFELEERIPGIDWEWVLLILSAFQSNQRLIYNNYLHDQTRRNG